MTPNPHAPPPSSLTATEDTEKCHRFALHDPGPQYRASRCIDSGRTQQRSAAAGDGSIPPSALSEPACQELSRRDEPTT